MSGCTLWASGDSSLCQSDVAAQPSTLPGSSPTETSRPRSLRADQTTENLKETGHNGKPVPTERWEAMGVAYIGEGWWAEAPKSLPSPLCMEETRKGVQESSASLSECSGVGATGSEESDPTDVHPL